MPRDDFTQSTKILLGQSVGFNCVRPGCAKPTNAMNLANTKIVGIGNAAHDSAAAPGGERYDGDLTPEQRRAIENGAWLCSSCARIVDIDPDRFPLGTLARWQQNAMQHRQMGMIMPNPPAGLDFKTGCESAQKFLRHCREITIDTWSYRVPYTTACKIHDLIRLCQPLMATNPYCAQFPHMVNMQNEMLTAIFHIRKEIESTENWYYDQEWKYYAPKPKQPDYFDRSQTHQNLEIDKSCGLVFSRFNDFINFQNELSSIACSPYSTLDLYGW